MTPDKGSDSAPHEEAHDTIRPDELEGDAPEFELFREPQPDPDRPAALKRQSRELRTLVVAGAKGGVGKTLLAANLGVYLATIGRRAVVVDADADGASIHGFLGVPHPSGVAPFVPAAASFRQVASDEHAAEPQDDLDEGSDEAEQAEEAEPQAEETTWVGPTPVSDEPIEVPIPGLRLLHAAIDEPARGQKNRADRKDLHQRVRQLDAEYVVMDIGSGVHPSLLDLWLDSEIAVFVTLPEPTAMEGMYRFVRASFARHLQTTLKDEQRDQLQAVVGQLGYHAPPPLDLLRELEKRDKPLAAIVSKAMGSFRFRFIVNQTRLRADLELGDRIQSAARRRLGVQLEYLGYVDYDDTVWNCLRGGRPLLVESPGTKASRNIEKIARRLLAVEAKSGHSSSFPHVPVDSHHDLLEVDRGATDEEIRRAFKRAKEIYAPGSLCCYGLFDERGLELLRARLEEGHDVLLDPSRRRPYELSVFPLDPSPSEAPPEEEDDAPKPPPPVITPETEFTGPLLRAVRESQGIALKEVSHRTKVGVSFLRAIEDDDYKQLPALVYVRGFVTEFAKCLKLDSEHVSRTYVRRFRKFMDEQGRS